MDCLPFTIVTVVHRYSRAHTHIHTHHHTYTYTPSFIYIHSLFSITLYKHSFFFITQLFIICLLKTSLSNSTKPNKYYKYIYSYPQLFEKKETIQKLSFYLSKNKTKIDSRSLYTYSDGAIIVLALSLDEGEAL